MCLVRKVRRCIARLQGGRGAAADGHQPEQGDREEAGDRAEDHQRRADQPEGIGEQQAGAAPSCVHQPRDRDGDERRADYRRCRGEAAELLGGEVRREQRTDRRSGCDADPAEDLGQGEDEDHPALGGLPVGSVRQGHRDGLFHRGDILIGANVDDRGIVAWMAMSRRQGNAGDRRNQSGSRRVVRGGKHDLSTGLRLNRS